MAGDSEHPEHFVGLSWTDDRCATGESYQVTSRGTVVKKVLSHGYRGTGSRQGEYDSRGNIRWY